MVVFAIPLRAKATTNNWDGWVKRLNQTIRSIFNQTCGEFKCIVACNERPMLDREYDDRLEFICLDLPAPKVWIEMARDKFWKLTVIAARIREILEEQANPENGIYVMPVDADDLLNCEIAAYCKEHPNENGFVSNDGYVWENGSKYFRIYPKMHTYCGSCNIIKMYQDDLPDKYPEPASLCHDQKTAAILNERYPIRFDHNTVVERYAADGKSFSLLPFRSTVYVLGTGDNISSIYQKENAPSGKVKVFHPIAAIRRMNIFSMKFILFSVK